MAEVISENAALPPHANVIGALINIANGYIIDKNIFAKGDVLMNGRERYTVVSEPIPYGEEGSNYWVIILDKPIPAPGGATLVKEYFKN